MSATENKNSQLLNALNSGKNDLAGYLSLKFSRGNSFIDFCKKYISNFDADRFEPLAVRALIGKESIITFYLKDKERNGTELNDKFPVKKVKIYSIPLTEVLQFVEQLNLTLSTGDYPLEDMEIENK
jgi:hypothetical protein